MPAPFWLTKEALQFVPFAAVPLSEIAENANRLYTVHNPAVANFAFVVDPTGAGNHEYVFALPLGGDSLTYDFALFVSADQTSTVQCDFYTSSTGTSGGWTLRGQVFPSGVSAWESWARTAGFSIPGGEAYGRLDISPTAGVCQVQCFCIWPSLPSLPTVKTADGFVPFDITGHLGTPDGPIHRELLNRVYENVRVVMRQRKQAVLGYADISGAAVNRWNNIVDVAHHIFVGGAHLPGQTGADLTVRYRINDVAGVDNACFINEVGGGASAELIVDDTDRTAVISEIASDTPQFSIRAAPDTSMEIRYIQADWTPGD